jgi:spore coat protein CotH
MVRLQVNGNFHGLYVEVEQPDKSFLSRCDLKGATLFKAVSKSHESDERDHGLAEAYNSHYDLETQKSEGYGELHRFCHDLNTTKNPDDFFKQRVDLDKYINYLVAMVLVENWDCFNKNHFLLYDGRLSKKWWVVPWDLDRTFGDHWQGGFQTANLPILLGTAPLPGPTGWNRMEAHFFGDKALRQRFLTRLEELLTTEFTPEKLFPVIDRLESDIATTAAYDRARWPSSTPDLHSGIAQLKSYITRRQAFLRLEVARLKGGGDWRGEGLATQ